jgi:hypothetical protein
MDDRVPYTEREAVERLIAKIEYALAKNRTIDVVGIYNNCPFCQYFVHSRILVSLFLNNRHCAKCSRIFGKTLGYSHKPGETSDCTSIIHAGIRLGEYGAATPTKRRAFLNELLPDLRRLLTEVSNEIHR